MTTPDAVKSPAIIAWAIGAATHHGETESGDHHVVAPFSGGVVVAVIDGLGHGAGAAMAASFAVEIIRQHPKEAVTPLLQRCHAELRRTRGAVASIASIRTSDDTMSWLGIGNVEGVLFRANPAAASPREALLLRGGVIGYQLPPLRAATLPIAPGDMLILATDGVSGRFSEDSPIGREPEDVAQDILHRYSKRTDDALVLVARYLGSSSS